MAHVYQPLRRSHDTLRRSLRRHLSAHPYRAPLDGVLHVSVSQHHGFVAAIPQPSDLGRFRGFHVRYSFAALLVRGFDTRPRDASRPRREEAHANYLRHAGLGLAWLRAPLAPLSIRVLASCRPGDASRPLRAYRGELRLCDRYRSWLA